MADVERLIRVAHESLKAAGLEMGCAKVVKLCRFYVRNVEATRHQGFIPWFIGQVGASGAQREALGGAMYRRLTYADPTGDKAVRNADLTRAAS